MRQQVTITPELASAYLTKNTDNRPLSRNTVRALTAAMKRGEWLYNGESIKFSQSGRLIDGQHRLHAVVASGVTIKADVIEDLPDDVFKTLDIGKRRNVSDTMTIAGEKNAISLSSAARTYAWIALKADQNHLTATMLMDVVDKHPHLRWWNNKFISSRARKFMPSSFVGVIALFADKYGSDAIGKFFEGVSEGVGLARNDPALVLREKFLERKRGQVIGQQLAVAYMIKAMNAYVKGKKLGFLRMFNDEPFPEVE